MLLNFFFNWFIVPVVLKISILRSQFRYKDFKAEISYTIQWVSYKRTGNCCKYMYNVY